MGTIILNHKTHGECYAEAEEFHNNRAMVKVKLKTPVVLPYQGTVRFLTVGKSAIKETSEGYVAKHKKKGLVERYLPLAISTAAAMRRGSDDYDELTSIASLALMEAADRYDSNSGVYFHVFAKRVIESRIKDMWRKEARKLEDANDFNFDELITVNHKTESDFMVEVEVATKKLRPRLRQLMEALFFKRNPTTMKELAYKWNVSEGRIRQLKQEAITHIKGEIGI